MKLDWIARTLPAGNGGFPRWRIQMLRKYGYRTFILLHVIVPRFQFCIWFQW